MPPRIDPYSSKTHRRIDIVLVVVTLLLMLLAFRFSVRARTDLNEQTGTVRAEQAANKR